MSYVIYVLLSTSPLISFNLLNPTLFYFAKNENNGNHNQKRKRATEKNRVGQIKNERGGY